MPDDELCPFLPVPDPVCAVYKQAQFCSQILLLLPMPRKQIEFDNRLEIPYSPRMIKDYPTISPVLIDYEKSEIMSKERRLQERFFLDIKARITYRFVNESSKVALETVAANISSGGAFFKTEHDLPLSSKVFMEFQLSLEDLKKLKFILPMESLRTISGGKVTVCATGVVIRRQEDGIAVIFEQNYQLKPMSPLNTSQ